MLAFFSILSFQNKHTLSKFKYLKFQGSDTPKLIEKFADSLNIGQKRTNKIELKRFRLGDSVFVRIDFFTKLPNNKWELKQKFEFAKDDVTELNVQLSDFNNDGLKDMTYESNIAGRGANEVRKLFIYKKALNKLIYIKNSEDYPNMQYNKYLNCIDAMLFFGGTAIVFTKIQKDSLKEFASVETTDYITVTIINNLGKEKVIKRIKTKKDEEFIRYRNFNPLKSY